MVKSQNKLQLKGHQRLQGMHYPMGTLHEECMVHKSNKILHPKNEQILTLEIKGGSLGTLQLLLN
jgi:hypothetical protein